MQKYGRAPKKGEVIHHLDSDPWNNKPANLILLPKIVHLWLHRFAVWGKLAGYEEELCMAIKELVKYNATKTN